MLARTYILAGLYLGLGPQAYAASPPDPMLLSKVEITVTPAAASAAPPSPGQTNAQAVPQAQESGTTTTTISKDPLFCTDCGFGPAIIWTKYNTENINSASTHGVAGGPVRIDDSNKSSVGLWFEAHYWLWKNDKQTIGVGPLVAVQLGSTSGGSSGNPFRAFGLGVMIGFLQKGQSTQLTVPTGGQATATATAPEPTRNQSWNIGIGIASTEVQTLGDGLAAGQPLPVGITDVYYKKERTYAPFITFSWAFE